MKDMSALFHQIILFYRPFETKLNSVLIQHGLQRAQWSTMYYINQYNSMTLVELANHQGVEKPTVSRTVAKLVEAGYITSVSTNDKREKRLVLTEEGEKFYKIVRVSIDAFEAELLKDVPEEIQEEMIVILQSLREKLNEEEA